MKISIWQQFSSNHSAGFIIVGTFNDPEKATKSAEELKSIFKRVYEWFTALHQNEIYDWHGLAETTNEITPEEYKLQSEYGIPWEHSLLSFKDLLQCGETIEVRGNHVIVEELSGMTWHGPQPVNILLEHMGANVNLQVWESEMHSDHELLANITCNLPDDDDQANKLFLRFQKDFTAHKADPYHVHESDTSDELEQVQLDYKILSDECFDDSVILYGVERKQNQLVLSGINFGNAFDSWLNQFDTLVSYLQKHGCTNIQYSFYSTECKQ